MGKKVDPGIPFYRRNSGHINKREIRLLLAEHDSDGYWIWSCLEDEGYERSGYFFDASDSDHLLIFAVDICKKPIHKVKDVITTCISRGLFDKTVYAKYCVLTNLNMQEVYLRATKEIRRKGTECEMIKEYIVLDKEVLKNGEEVKNIIFISRIVPGNNGQRIEENSKEKKTLVSPSAPLPKSNEKKSTNTKLVEAPEPYWTKLVDVCDKFIKENFPGEKIDFDGRNSKLFKELIGKLKARAKNKKREWTEAYALESLKYYLDNAITDKWIKDHFTIKNLVEQFQAVYQRMALADKDKKEQHSNAIKPNNINQEIQYLFGRYTEGQLDIALIKSDHYDRLVSHGYIPVNSLSNFEGEEIIDKQRKAVLKYFLNLLSEIKK